MKMHMEKNIQVLKKKTKGKVEPSGKEKLKIGGEARGHLLKETEFSRNSQLMSHCPEFCHMGGRHRSCEGVGEAWQTDALS